MVVSGNTIENLFVETESYQPWNKLSARKSGCKRLCSALSRSYVELSMRNLVLQDTLLNIPAWARLHPGDVCQEIAGPVKRISLQASLPCKRSKPCKVQSSTAQISEMTGSCKKVNSCTTGFEICQTNLPSHTGLYATCCSPCKRMILGCNNNNNRRTTTKSKCSRRRGRTRDLDEDYDDRSDYDDYNRSRGRSRSCSSSRSSSQETSRSRKRPLKGILKRSRSVSRSRRNRRGKKRSKRRVRFSRKITIWE